jgi:LytS/YehU family sensor histidine kinase
VPRLILQPLLDNAIRHGVERTRAAVRVEIDVHADGRRLIAIVRDHGGTRAPSTPGHGVGLHNTRARLTALHGDDHRLELRAIEGGGTEVTIDLPLRQPRAEVRA